MTYVTGMVAAVPAANKQKYIEASRTFDTVLKDRGATRVVECWGRDVPDGKLTSFPMAVKAEPGEEIVFSWVEWPSKEVADAAMAAMREEPAFGPDGDPMPFDGKRLIYGGFEVILEL